MHRLRSAHTGVDQGEVEVFSDFDTDGSMWTGEGPRERRVPVAFSDDFAKPPAVHAAISLWDVAQGANLRVDLAADKVTTKGFELIYKTWGDTRIARARVSWMAIGEVTGEDDWELT